MAVQRRCDAAARTDVFAANRAAGPDRACRSRPTAASRGGAQVYEDGPLRVRFPNAGDGALEAMIVNTAGGIAGGDRHDLDIAVGRGRAR